MRESLNHSAADARARRGEGGYALVALLALMTVLAISMTAAAPSLRQQSLREREQEAIYRGEEVADAIEQFARAKNGQLPKSMDELLEGIPVGTKKVQILRASAARDPLSSTGEWRLLQPRGREMVAFQQALVLYMEGRPLPQPQGIDVWKTRYRVQVTGITDLGKEGEEPPGGEDDSTNANVPFVGVASRSQRASVLTYYDIERHDHWVFTPLFR
ncbi:MAG TPA: hypothetical protein VFX96_02845 [Pyrinomonadaceae bacterium]|nr:hypothetical protein [Pyrinomonadaceae bacterium]